MRAGGIDLMFLPYGADFTYITGLTAALYYDNLKSYGDWINGLIIGVDEDPVLVLHKNFAINVPGSTWISDIRILPDDVDPNAFLAKVLSGFEPRGKTLAVDKMTWGQGVLSLIAAAPDTKVIAATDSFTDRIREVKDPDELEIMQRAAEITDQAMAATLKQMRIGMTEREVAYEVDYQIKRHGGDDNSFYPGIICVGNGSNLNRHIFERNTDMVLAPGTSVAFDFGVILNGYCSDFGRSAFMGEPNKEALAAYRDITDLNQTLMREMREGAISPAGIAARASEIMNAQGWGEHYMHMGLGHSIGLDVHENPWIRPGFDEPIRSNMTFTLEPKIWKRGVFYVRCEDVVVVGPDGSRSLTKFHYEPNVIA